MGLSLYQKYRPKNFEDVIGQELIVKALTNAIKFKRITHSYVFAGPHGTGKTTVARLYAKAINCLSLNQQGKTKCSGCANCDLFKTSTPVDIIELDAASNNGVDEIRDLVSTANYVPTQLLKKVYILDEAHMLTTSAWNALLKTLEECPKHSIFILATTEFHKIPLTVLSRCQIYSFRRISNENLKKLVISVAEKENVKIDSAANEKLVELANGSARDILTMFEQCLAIASNEHENDSESNKAARQTKKAAIEIKLDTIQQAFYLADTQTKLEILQSISENNVQNLNSVIEKLSDRGVDSGKLIRDLLNILVDFYIYDQTASAKNLHYVEVAKIKNITLNQEQIWKIIDELLILQKSLRYNPDDRLLIKLALMKVAGEIKDEEKISNKNNVEKVFDSVSERHQKIATEEKTPPIIKQEVVVRDSISPVLKEADKNYEQCFMEIATNADRELQKSDDEKFNEARKQETNKELSKFAKKIVISSPNGIVIIVESELILERLKNICDDNMYVNKFKEIINRPIKYVIACNKNQLIALTEKYKNAIKQTHRQTTTNVKTKSTNELGNHELMEKYFADYINQND